ncbi:MAG: hypothetical protein GY757_35050 [bacterium]|nr:hypothetical protein [bacterium]
MEEEKELERQITRAFKEPGDLLPTDEDKYFKNIWSSIECKAPVGEKYYLRSFFSMLFVFLFFVIFIFFYSEFLTSVLLLKEIRSENLKTYTSTTSPVIPRSSTIKPSISLDITNGIKISAVEHSKIALPKEEPDNVFVELDFFSGHMIVGNTGKRILKVNLPDIALELAHGKCNLFCYDNIVRITPLSQPVEVEYNGKRETLVPGTTFYLLDKKPLKVTRSESHKELKTKVK